MADEQFKIFVEQLRDGHVEEINEVVSPQFLDVHEKDLFFTGPIGIKGQAYLADDVLVMHLDIDAVCVIPCSICNVPVDVKIALKGLYHTVPLSEVRTGVYNFRNELRETVLLETPHLAECHGGKCPQRESMKKYLKTGSGADRKDSDEEGYKPFAGLDLHD